MNNLRNYEINYMGDFADIIIDADFSQEETESLELVSPLIFVTVNKEKQITAIQLCDEGFSVSCEFSEEEIKEVEDYIRSNGIIDKVVFE